MKLRFLLRVLFCHGFLGVSIILGAPAPVFEKDIRPILKAHCFECHGEGEKLKGGLDLRLRRFLLQGGDEGAAIVPGKPDQSLLFKMVSSGEMPKREKKLSRDQIMLLRQWIASGAKTARPEPVEIGTGSGITDEERAFWSFQPMRKPAVPKTKIKDRARTPIDAFLVRAMRDQNLRFSADAEKITLLRRAHFDLIGLPPTPEQVEAFLADNAPDAYERMLDRLLDLPQYGERWGRHWLDVAGYADSDGYSDADPPRPYAYKYRDYVIRSFNTDKPLDQFITEQLAGDELAGVTQSDAQTAAATIERVRDHLIATGFLRMGADGSATPAIDYDTVRNQVVADAIKIVSTSLLGLSVGCAQCHDHRYDPIPQTDYYRLRAIFEPAYNWKNWRNPDQRLVSLYTEADRKKAVEVEAEAKKLSEEREQKQKQYIAEALTKHLEKFEPGLREQLRAAYDAPAEKRTPEQKKLLSDNPSVNINPGVLYQYNQKAADDLKAMDAKIAEVRARKPVEDFIAALTEPVDNLPVTYLFHRGDHKQPKGAVPPGVLSVLVPPGTSVDLPPKETHIHTSGRRLAFARWLTSGTNPLVARVFVNRVWMHHFGRGLVSTPSDFGFMGERPSHPELLDWLANDFVEQGWRVKRLHKLIMTSTAYRQSSRRLPRYDQRDAEARFYWRKPVQRLDAEALRDAILAASGDLNPAMYGSPVPVRPDLHGQIIVGVDKTQGDNKMPVEVGLNGEEYRRSVYIQMRRSRPLAMLHAFDAPVMEVNCERRQSSTVATQSLMLMNSQFILDQARHFAQRLQKEAGEDRDRQIQRAWLIAFSRLPSDAELTDARAFLARQTEHVRLAQKEIPTPKAEEKPSEKKEDKPKPPPPPAPELQALTNLCQTLLSANEFLYVD
ncbi:MAG: PSD1 and planctomycete cytochrome C domain-containing protein [Verrucomicrobiota bacterium]